MATAPAPGMVGDPSPRVEAGGAPAGKRSTENGKETMKVGKNSVADNRGGRGRPKRRSPWALVGLAVAAATGIAWGFGLFDGKTTAAQEVVVYKSPTCGCCGKWADHLGRNGFRIRVIGVDDLSPIKQRYGVGDELASCHTAVVSGYVVEGHVPAADIQRLLAERPGIKGLTVPGMPAAAPGMDIPGGGPFDVLTFDAKGRRGVYARY